MIQDDGGEGNSHQPDMIQTTAGGRSCCSGRHIRFVGHPGGAMTAGELDRPPASNDAEVTRGRPFQNGNFSQLEDGPEV
jgi:hypothetical protein